MPMSLQQSLQDLKLNDEICLPGMPCLPQKFTFFEPTLFFLLLVRLLFKQLPQIYPEFNL